jgi:cytochrome P450
MSQWVMHRDARFFEEPGKFLPERWENPREETKLAYFPFGAGPRACFGVRLSFLTVKLVLVVLTRKFRFSLLPGREVQPVAAFALQPDGRVLVDARTWTENGGYN